MRHPICIRCAASDAVDLARGLLYGWAVAWYEAGGSAQRSRLARLYWLCWYWPGYVHPHGWGIPCCHGVKPNDQTPSGGRRE